MICPTCKKTFATPTPAAPRPRPGTAPFCSVRCRAADLGNWLNGAYRVSTPASEEDLDRGPDGDGDGDINPVN
ncbi:MAG TPA: DNA gyrase inhibitor YacG [Polyangia bacterium]|jgi:endogenous inhibitor of DNA gyrase (YacG/DUF329 family)